jgi:hypothetical protein
VKLKMSLYVKNFSFGQVSSAKSFFCGCSMQRDDHSLEQLEKIDLRIRHAATPVMEAL